MIFSSKWLCIVALLCFASIPAIAGDSVEQGVVHILNADHTIHVPSQSTIVAEGDSLTYGIDMTPSGNHLAPINGSKLSRSSMPYPETLAADLGHKVTVINRGFPGDRTIDGLMRWAQAPSGDLALILYGTNDCGNYGYIPGGSRSPEAFHAALAELVRRRQAEGAQVVLLMLPPLQDKDQEEKLKTYRLIVVDTAQETGAYLFDTIPVLQAIPDPWTDGIHLKPEAYAAIAHALAKNIKIERKHRQ